MIVKAVYLLLKVIVAGVSLLLPAWDPIGIASELETLRTASNTVFGLIRWADWYMPALLVVTLVVAQASASLGMHVWNGVVWVLTKLHVLGGA